MNRKLLSTITVIVAITGIVFALVPFSSSLQPSQKAKSERPQFDISNLSIGNYQFGKPNNDEKWSAKFMIIKDWDNSIYVNLIPVDDNKVFLPDRFWRWTGHFCDDLRPVLDDNNKIAPSGEILCHDENLPDGGREYWRWSYDGTSKNKWIADMYTPEFEIKGNVIYVNAL